MASVASSIGNRVVQSFSLSCQAMKISGGSRPSSPCYKVSVEEGVELITPESKPKDRGGDHFGLKGDPSNWIKLGTLLNPTLKGEEGIVEVFFKKKFKSKKTKWEAVPRFRGIIPSLHPSLVTKIKIVVFPKKEGGCIKDFFLPLSENLCVIEIKPRSRRGSKTRIKYLFHTESDGTVKEVASLRLNQHTYKGFTVDIVQGTPDQVNQNRRGAPFWPRQFKWLGYKKSRSVVRGS